ncbi:SRPBCC domain-containing protein [Planotetraspora phitsanulokensis]|uniref:SRPBCC domain-containing protein n=1 Tax=Planotetraspora phitsanulokensis TaxID=575192 RepID=A0A8J3XIX0_9ACTN|nr:SRPBCC domain-containing protein [Planotetraspora phitsanulokensis]GII42814.1 hypothetical protein Pph01_78170 [Planotetraspora phitsanulokensis]
MHTIDTSVVIEASPQEVWAVIVDFGRYEEWNPFILKAGGQAVVGTTLRLHIRTPGDDGMTHRPTVVIAEPAKHLQWLGKVAIPGLLAARHDFILEPRGEGTSLEGFVCPARIASVGARSAR